MSRLPICFRSVDNWQKRASRLLLVCLIQFAEGLSDQQAAEAVRGRLDWKYMLSLELTDPGFDASVLCEFRQRLLEGKADQLILQPLLDLALARGWRHPHEGNSGRTQRMCSGLFERSIGSKPLGKRCGRRGVLLATVVPSWLRTQVPDVWGDRYEKRFEG